ncbi:MAG: DNA methyltransferase [Gemmatimonadota bacterium]|nr:DNA methyltransferase [Gemmatimonadota bacterium]
MLREMGEMEEAGNAELNTSTDACIANELERLSHADEDYWAFRGRAARGQSQGLTQYPAMMVPAMQAVLIKVVSDFDGGVKRVLDPFAGSGTTLVECMRLGLDYEGQDINPLAVLFCRVKAGPFHINKLEYVYKKVIEKACMDRGRKIEAEFPGLEKWFYPDAITQLSRIRRAIRSIDHHWCRLVLWSGLAETVRQTSNSRTSTFKLHIRSKDDLESRKVNPIETFSKVISDITKRLHEEAEALRGTGRLTTNGFYSGDLQIRLCDSTNSRINGCLLDLLITSPPYGDNASTVPYGQYSYLPLQWIDLEDIGERTSLDCLRTTHEIDTNSLGGSRRNAVEEVANLLEISPSLKHTLDRLKTLPVDRESRVAAFCRDLNSCLKPIVAMLRRGAYMIWTIGNRRVGGKPVPTDLILKELLADIGVIPVTRVDRQIPSKRMATRNSIAKTMRSEAILVFRKA